MAKRTPTKFFTQIDDGTWARLKCPCGTVNWVYFSGDECAIDFEKIKCYRCLKEYWIESAWEDSSPDDPNAGEVEEGLKNPPF